MQDTFNLRTTRATVVIAIVILMALLLAPSAMAADTWTVDAAQPDNTQCVSPTFLCKDIQAAISAASPGDTINILNGTYVETVDITQDVILIGQSEAGVIIDTSSFSDYGIDAGGDITTVFQQFTLIGPPSATFGYGIKVAGENAFTTIQNVTVQNSGRSGIDLNELIGEIVDQVTLTNNGGVGLGLTDCDNVAISNVTTSGNAWGGIGIYTWGQYFTGGSDGISLSGTNSFAEANKLYIEVGNYTTPASPYPVTNFTQNTFDYTVQNDTSLPAYTFYAETEADAITGALGLPSPDASYINYLVDGSFIVGAGMTIQAAIDAASPGDTINVRAGTFAEDIIVDKSLDIRGPNYGISPNTGVRVAEAVVVPATAAISSGEIFHVEASDVSIDGFTIDGDNTALNSGYSNTTAADIDAAEGVTVYVDNVNNLTVSNNIIQNLSYFGVTIFGATYSAPATTGHLVDDNLFQDMGTYDATSGIEFWGGGVLLYNGQYAAVTNNVMENVRIGVQTGNFHSANPGAATYQEIDNNTIEARRRGIFHNLHTGSPSPYTLSNNDITALADANETVWDGILLGSLAVASTSSDNTIDGSAVSNPSEGYEVWNVDSTSPAAISGGSVSGVDIGLFLNNYEGYNSDASYGAHASVSGLSITPKAGGTGIRVLDSPSSTAHVNVQLAIGAGVTVNNGAKGMTVENTNASVTSTSDLAFSGQTSNYIELVNNAVDIDATGVSFDGQTGATATLAQNFAIEDKVVHKVDNISLGLVRVKAGEIFVTTSSGSIQRGIDAATAGNTVNVSAGTFNENVAVNKYLTMQGAGSTASDTVVNGAGSGAGLSITASGLSSANRVAISDLRVTNFANGVQTGGVSFVGLENVVSTANTSHGLELGNGTTDLLMTNCEFSYNTSVGIRAGTAATVTDFEMDGCAVDYNNIGMYIAQTGSGASNFSDVLIKNSTFNENKQKGIYVEKLHNATFDTVEVDHSGWDAGYDFSAGVDINLKYRSDYANISFVDSTITDNGVGALYGVGLTIKARDDGSYSGNPASLDNVSITGGTIDGNEVGVRFGEPGKNNLGPTDVTVSGVCISNNVVAGLTNDTQTIDTASSNWWGDASGPYNAATNPGGTGDAVSDDVVFFPWIVDGCGGTTTNETVLSASTVDPLFCTGESTIVTIDLAYAVDLYGYEFQISYNDTMVSAAGAFVDTFFDTTSAFIPGGWDADCTTVPGTCKFAATQVAPATAVSGSGQLAEITLTGVTPGTFNMTISGSTLSDIDGAALPHAVASPLPITVCGYATISGYVTMQGRPGNIVNPGTVTMIEQSPASFTPVAPVAFTPANGAYSISVPYLPGGSSYKILAEHGLYLDNEDIFNVSANLSNKDTRLWGGDANNDDNVTILDLSCVGGDFGSSPPNSTCGGTGSPDINADNKVNIQDLSITGGNFDKCGAQPWAWNVATPNFCPP